MYFDRSTVLTAPEWLLPAEPGRAAVLPAFRSKRQLLVFDNDGYEAATPTSTPYAARRSNDTVKAEVTRIAV